MAKILRTPLANNKSEVPNSMEDFSCISGEISVIQDGESQRINVVKKIVLAGKMKSLGYSKDVGRRISSMRHRDGPVKLAA